MVRGDWNAIGDMNTLIDVGTDGFILDELMNLSTGVGKRRVDQVILTHEHFDHAAGLKVIKKELSPIVYSHAQLEYTDHIIGDRLELKIGDKNAVIFHTPGHSNDSICVYVPEEKVLFAGDTAVNIKTVGGSYTWDYVNSLQLLAGLDIDVIYTGHDEPYTTGVKDMLAGTLENVLKSRII